MHELPPYETHDYGMDFRVYAENDVPNQAVNIWDKFGMFPPVPFVQWNRIVNEGHWPRLKKELPDVHPDHLYYRAILEYCKEYAFCYIGLN